MSRRILILNERDTQNPLAGGCEVHLFEVFRRLVKRGYEVTLLAATFRGCSKTDTIDGIRVRRLVNRYGYYAVAPLVARREARAGNFDIVIDVLSKLPFLSPWVVPLPCLIVVHHLFGSTAFAQASFPVALVTYMSEWLIPPCYRSTPSIAVSPSTARDFVDRGIDQSAVRVVPNGVDHDLYTGDIRQKAEYPLIVWLGRVEKYKRLDVMLHAMVEVRRALPDAKLMVVGDGSALDGARALAGSLHLGDCVEFKGFVSSKEKVAVLQRAHLLVNTSEKEGWGLTVIEGNACGVPTVASDVPGLRDSVRHGETGLLYDYGDVAQLVAAVLGILTDDKLRQEMAERALDWSNRFTWENVAHDVAAVIDAVVDGQPVAQVPLISSPF